MPLSVLAKLIVCLWNRIVTVYMLKKYFQRKVTCSTIYYEIIIWNCLQKLLFLANIKYVMHNVEKYASSIFKAQVQSGKPYNACTCRWGLSRVDIMIFLMKLSWRSRDAIMALWLIKPIQTLTNLALYTVWAML